MVGYENVTTVLGLLQSANNQTAGWFWFAMLFMVFIVIVLSSLYFGFEIATIGATFVMIIVSMLMWYGHFISFWQVGIFIAVFFLMIVYSYMTSYKES